MQLQRVSEPTRGDFVIGGWRIEPACNRIFHGGGEQRKLEPRLMHLLCLLAAHPGQTLSREELTTALWPRVVVTENSLTRAVSGLRKQLRGVGGATLRIETVPKKGYRLVAEPAPNAGANGDTKAEERSLLARFAAPLSAPFAVPFSVPWPAFAVSALALTILAGSWLTERGGGQIAPRQSDIAVADFGREYIPASSAGGGLGGVRHEAPVLSSDGGRFAFIRHDTSGSTIWLGDLRGGAEPVALYASHAPLSNLVWSPAGDALLFARHSAIATEAMYGGSASRQLMQFDLTTWTVSVLVEEPDRADQAPASEIDLT